MKFTITYPDFSLMFITIWGNLALIGQIFEFFTSRYNKRNYLLQIYKILFNRNVKDNFIDFIIGKPISKIIGKKEFKKVKNCVDLKTIFKTYKKISQLQKALMSKKGNLIFKIITKNPHTYKDFLKYFDKKSK